MLIGLIIFEVFWVLCGLLVYTFTPPRRYFGRGMIIAGLALIIGGLLL